MNSSSSLAPVSNGSSSNPTSPAQCRKRNCPPSLPPPFPHAAWTVGLLSGHGRYLTAEAFGNKLNMSGTILKKKQFWTLIQEIVGSTAGQNYNPLDGDSSHSPAIYLRSAQDRYLSIDKSGNVHCTAESPGPEQKFALIFNSQHCSFHIFSLAHSYYLSAGRPQVNSTNSKGGTSLDDFIPKGVNKPAAPNPDASEFWSLQLHVHPPAINLRHTNRERYARINGDLAMATEALPWGPEALFTLEITISSLPLTHTGPSITTYALRTEAGTYVGPDGTLCSDPTRAKYTLFFVQGNLALRDSTGSGKFLSAVGNDGVLKCKRDVVSKEELWTITGSYPQIYFVAPNDKLVSAQRGLDIAANQDEKTESETFQLENDASGRYWRFRTITDKYWSTGDNGGIQISQDAAAFNSKFKGLSLKNKSEDTDKTLYEITWLPNRRVGIKAVSNNKYITIKINRHLFATSSELGERESFKLLLANRSFIIIHGPEGYVGENKAIEGPLDTGKNYCEPTYIQQAAFDTYHFKTVSGLYWRLNENNKQVTVANSSQGEQPQAFFIIFKERSKIIIQAPNGNYLKLGAGKKLEASESDQNHAVVWNI